MNSKRGTIQRFLMVADIYFSLTGKTASDMNGMEMEEFYACVTKCNTPDEVQNLVKNQIRSGTGAGPGTENIHAGGWHMLPPGQRVL